MIGLSMGLGLGLGALNRASHGAAFVPTDIAGLIAWLDATAGATSSGGHVVSAPNKGSVGGLWVPGTNLAVPGQGEGPVLNANGMATGHPGFVFTAASAHTLKAITTDLVSATPPPITVFARVKPATPSALLRVLLGIGSAVDVNPGADIYLSTTSSDFQISTDFADDDANIATTTDPSSHLAGTIHNIAYVVDPANLTLRIDGAQVDQEANLATSTFTVSQLVIGAYADPSEVSFGPAYYDGAVSQILIYQGALTAFEITKVETWLSTL